MSRTRELIESDAAPHNILSEIYERIQRAKKEKVYDADTLQYEWRHEGIHIELHQDEYCGRGCHCYHGRDIHEYLLPDGLITAYEELKKFDYTDGEDGHEYALAAFDFQLSQYIEGLSK